MESSVMSELGRQLIARKLTIAFAESATAGWLCSEFSLIDDAGKFLQGGISCYDADLKEKLLGVDKWLIENYTPESMEVTRAIAIGLKTLIPADIHIGVTGLTSPGGSETADKPVGTMFVYACSGTELIFSRRLNFSGSRKDIVTGTVSQCAELLLAYLISKQTPYESSPEQ